jgi:hypothetical protein
MIPALQGAVGVPGYEDHGDHSKQIGDHNGEANHGVDCPPKTDVMTCGSHKLKV